MKADNTRFKDALWAKQKRNIVQIGAGGIGRPTCYNIVSLGHSVTVYDFDRIENHNCIPQGYPVGRIGLYKVHAIKEGVKELWGNVKLDAIPFKFDETSLLSPIMIAAVDNMAARKLIFERWKSQENRELLIDGRMLAEYFQIFLVTPETENEYQEYLFDDADVPPMACTYQQTKHTADIIGGRITQHLCNYLAELPIPFKDEYNGIIGSFDIV